MVKLEHVRGLAECWFQTATDDNLTCDQDDKVPHRVIYRRDEIRKVYLKPELHLGQSRSPWFAAPLELTAGAGGSVLMLRHFPNGPAAVGLAGFIGGASITALIVHHFNHGQLIYRSRYPAVAHATNVPLCRVSEYHCRRILNVIARFR